MRRDHYPRHGREDPLVHHLSAEYGGRVPHGLIEARVALLCDAVPGQDRLSAEHLARSEVAGLAARPAPNGGRRRR